MTIFSVLQIFFNRPHFCKLLASRGNCAAGWRRWPRGDNRPRGLPRWRLTRCRAARGCRPQCCGHNRVPEHARAPSHLTGCAACLRQRSGAARTQRSLRARRGRPLSVGLARSTRSIGLGAPSTNPRSQTSWDSTVLSIALMRSWSAPGNIHGQPGRRRARRCPWVHWRSWCISSCSAPMRRHALPRLDARLLRRETSSSGCARRDGRGGRRRRNEGAGGADAGGCDAGGGRVEGTDYSWR